MPNAPTRYCACLQTKVKVSGRAGPIVALINNTPPQTVWYSYGSVPFCEVGVLNLNDAIIRLRDGVIPTPRRAPRPGKPLVLIVDDIVEQRELYEFFLASYFELVSAARGPEAIAIAVARQPDAIVLDVEMPEMNGLEVCRRLKRHRDTAGIPVLMLTGIPNDIHVEAMAAGAAAVLKKPCSVDALLDQIVGSIITAQALAPAQDDLL